MIPRSPSKYALIALWLTGASVYFIIELWPCDLIGYYDWSKEVGDYIKKLSLAFTTAFPFWYVQQWLLRRRMRVEVAHKQRVFLDKVTKIYNDRVEAIFRGDELQMRAAPDHLQGTAWELVDLAIDRLAAKDERWASHLFRIIAVHAGQVRSDFNLLVPYQASFSIEFNRQAQEVYNSMERALYRGMNVNAEHVLTYAKQALRDLGLSIQQLEATYRKDHKLPK